MWRIKDRSAREHSFGEREETGLYWADSRGSVVLCVRGLPVKFTGCFSSVSYCTLSTSVPFMTAGPPFRLSWHSPPPPGTQLSPDTCELPLPCASGQLSARRPHVHDGQPGWASEGGSLWGCWGALLGRGWGAPSAQGFSGCPSDLQLCGSPIWLLVPTMYFLPSNEGLSCLKTLLTLIHFICFIESSHLIFYFLSISQWKAGRKIFHPGCCRISSNVGSRFLFFFKKINSFYYWHWFCCISCQSLLWIFVTHLRLAYTYIILCLASRYDYYH